MSDAEGPAVQGAIYAVSPETAFTVATIVGLAAVRLAGVGFFPGFGEAFEDAVAA